MRNFWTITIHFVCGCIHTTRSGSMYGIMDKVIAEQNSHMSMDPTHDSQITGFKVE